MYNVKEPPFTASLLSHFFHHLPRLNRLSQRGRPRGQRGRGNHTNISYSYFGPTSPARNTSRARLARPRAATVSRRRSCCISPGGANSATGVGIQSSRYSRFFGCSRSGTASRFAARRPARAERPSELVWTLPSAMRTTTTAMTELRLRQASECGPPGFISMADVARPAFVQRGIRRGGPPTMSPWSRWAAAGHHRRKRFSEAVGRGFLLESPIAGHMDMYGSCL